MKIACIGTGSMGKAIIRAVSNVIPPKEISFVVPMVTE